MMSHSMCSVMFVKGKHSRGVSTIGTLNNVIIGINTNEGDIILVIISSTQVLSLLLLIIDVRMNTIPSGPQNKKFLYANYPSLKSLLIHFVSIRRHHTLGRTDPFRFVSFPRLHTFPFLLLLLFFFFLLFIIRTMILINDVNIQQDSIDFVSNRIGHESIYRSIYGSGNRMGLEAALREAKTAICPTVTTRTLRWWWYFFLR